MMLHPKDKHMEIQVIESERKNLWS